MSKLILVLLLAALNSGIAFADGAWISLAPMPDARQEVAVAEVNGKIYVVGGLPRTNLVQEYDPANNNWRLVAPLPVAVDHAAAVGLGGKLYVMGGNTGAGQTDALYEYDPARDQWVQRAAMPTARSALAAVVIAGKIYAVGGSGATQRELEVYDPAADAWTRLAPMPTGRNHIAAGAIKGKLYVAGGRPGNLAVLEEYDPATDSWTTKAPMPTARSGHAGAVVRDKFYTFGGEGNPNSSIGIFQETEAYDPQSDSWRQLQPMPTPRHGIGAAVIGNRIFIPGGATQQGGGTQTTVNEAFVVQPEKVHAAHFASGQGINTEIVIANPADNQDVVVTVELFDQSGSPLAANLGGMLRSRATEIVRPGGSITLRLSDPNPALNTGSAMISADAPVTGVIIFSSTIQNFAGTAGVGLMRPLTRFLVPVQRDPFSRVDTGIAIANATDSEITVRLALRNEGGAVLDRSDDIELPPRGQIARFLQELFPRADIVTFSFRGTVSGTSTGGAVALALLFTGSDFATLPVSGN